jgi:hypothetical protein
MKFANSLLEELDAEEAKSKHSKKSGKEEGQGETGIDWPSWMVMLVTFQFLVNPVPHAYVSRTKQREIPINKENSQGYVCFFSLWLTPHVAHSKLHHPPMQINGGHPGAMLCNGAVFPDGTLLLYRHDPPHYMHVEHGVYEAGNQHGGAAQDGQ